MTSDRRFTRAKRSLISALLLLTAIQALARPSDTTATAPADSVDRSFWSRYNMARVGAIGIAGGTMVYSAGVWWVNDYRPFHYYKAPWIENLGVDKIGHLYTSYAMYKSLHETLLWGGHDEDDAFWWAAGTAAVHGLGVEIGDGFSEYGFDYHDLAFNYMGLAYGIAQTKIPFLRNFDIKWSLYYPMRHNSFRINFLYQYHIYWVSANVKNLLPEGVKEYWPGFLQIAFGLGAEDPVQDQPEILTTRTYNISLDYNLEKIPIDGRDINVLKRLLNLFHLPAPGMKFAPGHAPEFRLFLLH